MITQEGRTTEVGVQTSRWLIEHLLQAEHAQRAFASVRHQIKAARLPLHRDLAGFDFEASTVDKKLVQQLSTLEFIDTAQNVVLIGGPGTGKTHLATAIGVAAALEKCRALADVHIERADTGGLQEVKAEKRRSFLAQKTVEAEKSSRTLQKLLDAYVAHLKTQGRRSHVDAQGIFQIHVTEAWPAVDLTPDQVLDMLRRLIESGKGRTANKLRSYLRAAYQCALDVRTLADIPVAFKAFGIAFNPAAQTRRSPQFDRADKRPLALEEMKEFWRLISAQPGPEAATLRLHLLTGGQRIEQFIRLRWEDVGDQTMTLFDGKGRPSQGPRPHQAPLVSLAVTDLKHLRAAVVFSQRNPVEFAIQ